MQYSIKYGHERAGLPSGTWYRFTGRKQCGCWHRRPSLYVMGQCTPPSKTQEFFRFNIAMSRFIRTKLFLSFEPSDWISCDAIYEIVLKYIMCWQDSVTCHVMSFRRDWSVIGWCVIVYLFITKSYHQFLNPQKWDGFLSAASPIVSVCYALSEVECECFIISIFSFGHYLDCL